MTDPAPTPPDKSRNTVAVTVTATVHGRDVLFLRQAGATAENDAERWELSTNIATGHPIILAPCGRWVTFDWHTLIEAARTALAAVRL